ncbi:toprim domain-containing protein [Ligilactobacillus agilis]|nr:toprim domain-containing protein [Ligilactobacillus agilis]
MVESAAERLGSLMKTRFGVTRPGRVRFSENDNLYTSFRKLAKYIGQSGEWSVEDEKRAAEILVRTNINYLDIGSNTKGNDQYLYQVEVATEENVSGLAGVKEYDTKATEERKYYKVTLTTENQATGEQDNKTYLVSFDTKNKQRNSHGRVIPNWFYPNHLGVNDVIIGDLDRSLGYSKIYSDLSTNLAELEQKLERKYEQSDLVKVEEFKGVPTLSASKIEPEYVKASVRANFKALINDLNDGSANKKRLGASTSIFDQWGMYGLPLERYKKTFGNDDDYYFYTQQRGIPIDVLETYLNDTYDLVLQHENLRSANNVTRARAWETKKHINKATQAVMAETRLLKHFNYVELDNQVDLEKFQKFEAAADKLMGVLPLREPKPTLRLRKLGNIKTAGMQAAGLYVPEVNTIAVDFRDNSVESFAHEYGHYLDYNDKTGQILSMTPEFKEIVHAYRERLSTQTELKGQAQKQAYYGTPTEVWARGFEVYLSNVGLQTPLLKTLEAYSTEPQYLPYQTPELTEKIQRYFKRQFPDLEAKVKEFTQLLEAEEQKVEVVAESKEVETAQEQMVQPPAAEEKVESKQTEVSSEVQEKEPVNTSDNDTQSKGEESPKTNQEVEESYRLRRARQKLARLEGEVSEAGQQVFDHYKQTNGQPMNDKRNGASFFKRANQLEDKAIRLSGEVEKQRERVEALEWQEENRRLGFNRSGNGLEMSVKNIPRIKEAIERFERGEGMFTAKTIQRYRNELVKLEEMAKRSQVTLSPGAQKLVDEGAVKQWEKKPVFYFVKGLRKVAFEVDEKGNFKLSSNPKYQPTTDEAEQRVNELLTMQQAETEAVIGASKTEESPEVTNESTNLKSKERQEKAKTQEKGEEITVSEEKSKQQVAAPSSQVQPSKEKAQANNDEASVAKQSKPNYAAQKQVAYQERKKVAKSRNILEVADVLGMELTKVGQTYKWREHDSLTIFPKNNNFKWFSTGAQGDPIDLVQAVLGVKYAEAVEYLLQDKFKGKVPANLAKVEKRPFEYKLRDHKSFNHGYEYLTKERGLSKETIDFFLKQGVVSEATRLFKNGDKPEPVITFKAFDDQGKLRGATLQGTRYDAKYGHGYRKEIVANSDGNFGLSVQIGQPKKLVFCESSIDLMSYYELHKDSLADVRLVSMDGLKPATVDNYCRGLLKGQDDKQPDGWLKKFDQHFAQTYGVAKTQAALKEAGYEIILAVDNDQRGRQFVDRFKDLQVMPIKVDLPPNPNKSAKVDWNDYLKEQKGYQVRQTKQKQPEPKPSKEPEVEKNEAEKKFVPFPKRRKKKTYAPPRLPEQALVGTDGFDYLNKPMNEVADQTVKFIRGYDGNGDGFKAYMDFMAENPQFDFRNAAIIQAMNPGTKGVGTFAAWNQVKELLEKKGYQPDEFLNKEIDERRYEKKKLGILKGARGIRLLKKKKWYPAYDQYGRPYYVDGKRVMRREDQLSPLEQRKNGGHKGFLKRGPSKNQADDYKNYHVYTLEQTNLKQEYFPLLQQVWSHRYDYNDLETVRNFQAGLADYAKRYSVQVKPVMQIPPTAETLSKQIDDLVSAVIDNPRYRSQTIEESSRATEKKANRHEHKQPDRFKLQKELTSYLVKRHFGLVNEVEATKAADWAGRLNKLSDTKLTTTLSDSRKATNNMIAVITNRTKNVEVTLDYVQNYSFGRSM